MTRLIDDQDTILEVIDYEVFDYGLEPSKPSSSWFPGPEILVPSSWPDPADHRMAYDREADGFFFILEDDLAVTAMTLGELQDLNNEDNDTAITIPAVSNVKTKVFGIVFDEPKNVTGYFLVSDHSSDTFLAVEKSEDTTDGMDGTWEVITTAVVGAYNDGIVNPAYRIRVSGLGDDVENIRGIRFKQNGNTSLNLRAMHFYGDHGSAATTDRLSFWDPTLDQVASINNLNFGDAPRKSSKDLRFRVKNVSDTIVTAAVSLAIECLTETGPGPRTDLQMLLSRDNGRTFSSTLNIGTLAPDQVSQVITLRRVTPIDADLGAWAARVIVSGSGGVREATEYSYMGNVSENIPDPHIWYVYPPSGIPGTIVEVVGMGFGDSEAELDGEVMYGGVPLTPSGWSGVAADGDAYTPDRSIQTFNNVTDPQHQRIVVAVPALAEDDYFTVGTQA